ncbi:MAG: phospholipid carrier-dependent glycosyltransferase [Propionibacteriaceae bacterium]|nr:phospholipid carrier-dependent glycosyltransferase [Propionibacteriaceae bacterium]
MSEATERQERQPNALVRFFTPKPLPSDVDGPDGVKASRFSTIYRLRDDLPLRADEPLSWLVTLGLMLLALATRLPNLAQPKEIIFDETYYAKEAWSVLHFGYARNWPDGANDMILEGNTDVWEQTADFVVHPMLGKWLIAAGEWMFGMNSYGWRFMAVIFGVLLVGATTRMARRLSRSTLVGAIAGLFIVCDGLSFMLSRIALLDGFQAPLAVIAVAFVARDRDWFRNKLADYLEAHGMSNLDGHYGPLLLWRPYRLLAGVFFGLSCGVKWNTMYMLAAMGLFSIVMDWRSRRTAGARSESWRSLFVDGPLAFFYLVIVAIGSYLATWTSWFVTAGGWDRQWALTNQDTTSVRSFGNALASLWHYHVAIWDFHVGDYMAAATHPYSATPWQWIFMGRVIGIHVDSNIQPGVDGCDADAGSYCLRVITGMGTPALWWMAAIAVVAGLVFWLFGRDWRFALPLAAAGAVWLGWFPNADRPLFYFYAIMLIPFTATVLAMCTGKILGPADAPPPVRRRRAIIAGGLVLLVVLNFIFIFPVASDQLLTHWQWQMRMWFRTWI